ncbi:hypothetical protein HUU42_12205 [bacterium]|nr:hypothetical protein [bacterium]
MKNVIILAMAIAIEASICAQEAMIKPQKAEEILACYFDVHLFSAQYGLAKVVTTGSDATKGEYEVEWLYNSHATEKGKRAWTKHVITKFHPAEIVELKTGMVVMFGSANKMTRGIVKEVLPHKGVVILEWFHAPGEAVHTAEASVNNIIIIDEPKMTDPRKKS